jgi:hypothetical protein
VLHGLNWRAVMSLARVRQPAIELPEYATEMHMSCLDEWRALHPASVRRPAGLLSRCRGPPLWPRFVHGVYLAGLPVIACLFMNEGKHHATCSGKVAILWSSSPPGWPLPRHSVRADKPTAQCASAEATVFDIMFWNLVLLTSPMCSEGYVADTTVHDSNSSFRGLSIS